MPFVKTLDILNKCEREQFAVGAFNVNGLDQVQALIKRAGELKSPILITLPGVIEPYVDLAQIGAVTRLAAEKAEIPVGLHLSHGMDLGVFERALKAGFTSVMFDGSKLAYEENVKQTKIAAEMGHSYGAAVEGELGALPGASEGGAAVAAGDDMMTDPALAKDYVERTGVDILAVAIGNAHGLYKGKPSLDFQRLEQIHYGLMKYDVYLTLHGGTGIPEDHVRRAIGMGIVKICIYTEMCVEGKNNAKEYVEQKPDYQGNFDIPELIGAINKGFMDAAEQSMKMFLSTGRVHTGENYASVAGMSTAIKPEMQNDIKLKKEDKDKGPVINDDIGPEYPSKLAARPETIEAKAGVYWHTNV